MTDSKQKRTLYEPFYIGHNILNPRDIEDVEERVKAKSRLNNGIGRTAGDLWNDWGSDGIYDFLVDEIGYSDSRTVGTGARGGSECPGNTGKLAEMFWDEIGERRQKKIGDEMDRLGLIEPDLPKVVVEEATVDNKPIYKVFLHISNQKLQLSNRFGLDIFAYRRDASTTVDEFFNAWWKENKQ